MQAATVEAPSPRTSFGVVFEDDEETGYIYGLELSQQGNPIVDAMHLYNVAQVVDRDKPSSIQIFWSSDGLKAAVLINKFPHAVFDFEVRRGYCRTNFPPADLKWTKFDHAWDDRALELFR